MTDQYRTRKPVAKRVSDDLASDQVSARRVHSPSISNSTLYSSVTPAPIENNLLLMPNQYAPIPTSNGYGDIYSSGSEDDTAFEKFFSNDKTVNSINTYSVVPPRLTLASKPPKVLKKNHKTRGRIQLATTKQAQSNKTASDRFLSTALHSFSQAITRAHTDKIDLYNNIDTACCAESGSSEEMLPDYSTFNTYHRISNCCDTLGDTNMPPIEGIDTVVYTLNGCTILICNALHITALKCPLYSLRKHRQIPG